MIKLVTQFDNEKTKLSLATPTCGCCCCCCCCCIVSTIATASISARNFANYVEKELSNEPKKIMAARRFGFLFPLGLLVSVLIGFRHNFYGYSDEFALPIIMGIIYLLIVTYIIKKTIKLPGMISRIILFTALMVVFEAIGLYVGIIAIINLREWYFVIAGTIAIILILWTFQKDYNDLDNNDSNTNDSIQPTENITDSNFEDKLTDNQAIENVNDVKHDNTNDFTTDLENKDLNLNVVKEKKKCPKCGTDNSIDNKRCFYCSNIFEEEDDK